MKAIYKKYAPLFIVAILGAVIGGGLVMGYGPFFNGKSVPDAITQIKQEVASPTARAQLSPARNTPIVRAAQIVGPSVVGITNKAYVSDLFNRRMLVERGSGSGVIYDAAGHIVTNYHVVAEAEEIVVSLADGRTVPGKVQGVDPALEPKVSVLARNCTRVPFLSVGPITLSGDTTSPRANSTKWSLPSR